MQTGTMLFNIPLRINVPKSAEKQKSGVFVIQQTFINLLFVKKVSVTCFINRVCIVRICGIGAPKNPLPDLVTPGGGQITTPQ